MLSVLEYFLLAFTYFRIIIDINASRFLSQLFSQSVGSYGFIPDELWLRPKFIFAYNQLLRGTNCKSYFSVQFFQAKKSFNIYSKIATIFRLRRERERRE